MVKTLLEKQEYKVLILITPILLMYGCEQNQRYLGIWPSDEEMCKMVKDINMSDGVNENEAETLADVYFCRFTPSSCGGIGRPVDKQDYWDVPVAIGYAAQPWGVIVVDKQTAKMSWEHGPTIKENLSRP
ncbi:MAG: hypothetical protein ABII09_12020 [Planctomycetota bacterium]